MKKQKILLFGGSGFLGSELITYLSPYIIVAPTHKELDIVDIDRVYEKIETTQPDVIIYSAGMTKIDAAESNKELAFLLNATVPKKISTFASVHNIPFVYISTDAVFDGYQRKFIFAETDSPKTKSVYGLSKLKGEESVLSANTKNSIIRLITLYGINNAHQNFLSRVLNDLNTNKPVLGIIDQIQNPLFVSIAAEGIAFIVNSQLNGIYHLGALDYDANYHFLVTLAKKFNFDTGLINKISYKEFFKEKNGNRKQKSVLSCMKFAQISQNKILRTIDSSLDYLKELHPDFLSK